MLRTLGKSDIRITPIGLGMMQFAGRMTGFQNIRKEEKRAIVKAALDGGINWFDTAEAYGFGLSERGLSDGLQAAGMKDGDIFIATKWLPVPRTAGNIKRTITSRQRHLSPYSIGLHQVHAPYGFSATENEMNAMADLVEAGVIGSVGVSNFGAERMRRAHKALEKRGIPLVSNQLQYSLIYRKIETSGVLETARELGITIIAWSPIGSGILTGKFHKDPELLKKTTLARRLSLERKMKNTGLLIGVLDEIATAHQVTQAQVALNWLINFHGDTVVAIPGASIVNHAIESAGVMKFTLSEEEMARLDEASKDFRT